MIKAGPKPLTFIPLPPKCLEFQARTTSPASYGQGLAELFRLSLNLPTVSQALFELNILLPQIP